MIIEGDEKANSDESSDPGKYQRKAVIETDARTPVAAKNVKAMPIRSRATPLKISMGRLRHFLKV